jgi:Mg-chelatase subunit ChlI
MSAAPAGESRTIVGEIVWVDLKTRLVLIRESVKTTKVKGQPPARQTVAVSIAPDIAVTRGRKRVSLEDLKAKDHVTARYVATADGAKALSFRVAEATPPPQASAASPADTTGGN